MLSAVLILSLGPQDAFARKIDYETRGKDITAIVRDLRDSSGQKLDTNGLRDWPLIVSLKKRTLRETMNLLAEATDSVWIEKEGRRTLTRTPARVAEAARREAENRGRRLKAWMTANLGIAEPLREWTDAEIKEVISQNEKSVRERAASYLRFSQPKDYMTNRCETPAKILLLDFCRQVKPEVLGAIPVNEVVTFSTNPAPDEKPMPVGLGRALNVYMKSRARFAAQISPDPLTIDSMRIMSNERRLLHPIIGEPTILVSFMRPAAMADVHADVLIQDADRSKTFDVYGTLLKLAPLETSPLQSKMSGQVELSSESAEILKGVGRAPMIVAQVSTDKGGFGLRGQFVPPYEESILRKLQDPLTFEPISTFVADWMISTARALKSDLIATVPDSSIYNIATQLQRTTDLDALWKLQVPWQLSFRLDSGILKVGAIDVARNDRYRVDRKALATLLSKFGPDRLPSLDDCATYAVTQPPSHTQNNLDYFWMSLVDPNQTVFQGWRNPRLLRFWGSLTPAQRAQDGLKLEAGTLTATQQAHIDGFLASRYQGSPLYDRDSAGTFNDNLVQVEAPPTFRVGTLTVTKRPGNYFLGRFTNRAVAGVYEHELGYLFGAEMASPPIGKIAPIALRSVDFWSLDFRFDEPGGNYRQYPGYLTSHGRVGREEEVSNLSPAMKERLAKIIEEGKAAKYRPVDTGTTNPPPP